MLLPFARTYVVGNVKDGIRDAPIFRLGGIVVIRFSTVCNFDVFQQCIRVNSPINIRFSLFRQIDRLGVAPAFKVEDAITVPSMFIVPNQGTFGISAECGFSVEQALCVRETVLHISADKPSDPQHTLFH